MAPLTVEQLSKKVNDYIAENDDNLQTINRVLFGDKYTGDIGMKEKVDEIYKRITQVDGIGGLLKWIIILGSVITVLKVWLK